MDKLKGCAGSIAIFLWYLIMGYLSLCQWLESIKWDRRRRGKWLFSRPSLIKLANRVSGKHLGLDDARFIEVLGLGITHEHPESLICRISETTPIKYKTWPPLRSGEIPMGAAIYGYAPGFPFGELKTIRDTLLSLEDISRPRPVERASWNIKEE